MNRLFAPVTLALLLAAPLLAHAVEITADTAEYVTFRDCIAGATGCDDVSPIVSGLFGGNPGAVSSAASENFAGYGSASGSVSLSGDIGAPILHASASSDAGKRTNTNSVALQSYTYTGSDVTTRTFGGTLTYSQTETGAYPDDAGVYATIDAFQLSTPGLEVGSTPDSNFYTLLDGGYPGYTDIASDTFVDTGTTASGLGTLSVTVTLTPGETIWLQVLLQTPAANASIVDASHTLITGWNDTTDLTPAAISAPVPEPSSWALFGAGFALLLTMRRLRRA